MVKVSIKQKGKQTCQSEVSKHRAHEWWELKSSVKYELKIESKLLNLFWKEVIFLEYGY